MAEEEKKRFLDGNEMELGEKQGKTFSHAPQPSVPRYNPPSSNWQNNPILPVISYCGSSILMTVANKYILSFPDYNLNFLLLAVQVRQFRSTLQAPSADWCSLGNRLRCRNPVLQNCGHHHIPRL